MDDIVIADYNPLWPELYASLKRGLAERFFTDRLAYNDAKTACIEAVLAKARGHMQKAANENLWSLKSNYA
jgi:GrpB-like predicted nucleotidyltransferase (UPF0157 family)